MPKSDLTQLQAAVPGALVDLLRSTPLSPGKVGFVWKASVGGSMQRATEVRLEGDVLLVDTTSLQWAREVMRSSPVILRRLQAFLGKNTVAAIRARPPASEIKAPRRRRASQNAEPGTRELGTGEPGTREPGTRNPEPGT